MISNSNDLSVLINVENFQSHPEPINLTFNIFNEIGELVYLEEDLISFESPTTHNKKFNNLNLGKGNYTLILKFFYNHVENEFKAEFEVNPKRKGILSKIIGADFFGENGKVFYILVILFVLIIFYFIHSF